MHTATSVEPGHELCTLAMQTHPWECCRRKCTFIPFTTMPAAVSSPMYPPPTNHTLHIDQSAPLHAHARQMALCVPRMDISTAPPPTLSPLDRAAMREGPAGEVTARIISWPLPSQPAGCCQQWWWRASAQCPGPRRACSQVQRGACGQGGKVAHLAALLLGRADGGHDGVRIDHVAQVVDALEVRAGRLEVREVGGLRTQSTPAGFLLFHCHCCPLLYSLSLPAAPSTLAPWHTGGSAMQLRIPHTSMQARPQRPQYQGAASCAHKR